MRLSPRSLAITLFAVVALALGATPASAAPSHFNTLPYETGCATNKMALSTLETSLGTITVMYSRTCGTNWVEWSGYPSNTSTGKTLRTVGGAWTTAEYDTTGWAYSRQVYAPLNTAIEVKILVVRASGSFPTLYTAHCASTCTWTSEYSASL